MSPYLSHHGTGSRGNSTTGKPYNALHVMGKPHGFPVDFPFSQSAGAAVWLLRHQASLGEVAEVADTGDFLRTKRSDSARRYGYF